MRKGYTLLAAAIATSLVATPMVILSGNASATPEHALAPELPAIVKLEAIAAVPAVTSNACMRKVRVVYGAGISSDAAPCSGMGR